jgi:hypothetical protein
VRLLLAMFLALALVAGCGGDDDDTADSGTDVNQLLEDTFSGDDQITSANVDFSGSVGGANPLNVKLSGPFQTQGDGKLPKLDIQASLEGGGQTVEGGITSTGDQGFVSYQGTDYAVSGPVFRQFEAAWEQAASQQQGESTSLGALGIDPRNWLTDAKNAGDSKVGDTDTIKITGGVDVGKLLDDVDGMLERARSLGLQGSGDLPERLSEAQRRQVTDAIKNLKVEIDTGKDDHILRRMAVSADVNTQESGEVPVRLELTLLDVNEDQQIEAPENPRPFNELLKGLQELGIGGLGATQGGSGSSGGGASSENLEKYSQCVQDAGSDTNKLRECGKLLTP